jgi:D-alanine-D-alanine ligase
MKQRDKVLVVFDVPSGSEGSHDFEKELETEDWATEGDVVDALEVLRYPYELLGISDDVHPITEKIKEFKPGAIFNLVESFSGNSANDRDIASFYELHNIPFTGCGPTGLTLCKNKGISKEILSYHRIRVPGFVSLPRKKPIHRPKRLRFPIFIKPLRDEASYGIAQASFVENDDQFTERVRFIHETMQQDVIAEEYIEGRELYVSVLGNKRLDVFPIRELRFSQVPDEEPKIATFKAKWDESYRKRWGIKNQFVGPLSNGTVEKIEKISKKIYRLLSIRGYARLDLRLTEDGEIVFIEANPNPILAKAEDFSESAVKGGVDYPQLIEKILNLATYNHH